MGGKTCVPCRARKVRCDGTRPVCLTCSKSTLSLTCSFAPKSKNGALPRREACFPCRQKKRRCDAVRPACGTCQKAISGTCAYEENTGPHCLQFERDCDGTLHIIEPRVRHIAPNPDSSGRSSSSTDTDDLQAGAFALIGLVWPCEQNETASTSNIRSISPAACFDDFCLEQLFPSPQIQIDPASTSSWTLEDMDRSRFALSGVSLDDINITFRMLYLSQRLSYGVQLPLHRCQALISGDLSGELIHEFFIHFANLAGCHLYQERAGSYCILYIQAAHLQSTLDAFSRMKEEDDPLAYAQACWSLSAAYGTALSMKLATFYFRKSVEVIRRNNIRFTPELETSVLNVEDMASVSAQQPYTMDHVHEKVAFLGQMVYLETAFYIAGLPDSIILLDYHLPHHRFPRLHSEIHVLESEIEGTLSSLEDEFRYSLPSVYPVLFQLCPIMLRVQSTLFAKDGNNLVVWFHQGNISAVWPSTCQIFLSQLRAHVDVLATRYANVKAFGDGEAGANLRYSSMLSFTTLAQVLLTMARNVWDDELSRIDFMSQCDNALKSALLIVENLDTSEFRNIDILLGASGYKCFYEYLEVC